MTFDRVAFRGQMRNTLAELRVSHDATDATQRLAATFVPPEMQVEEFCEWLALVVQESSSVVRHAGFTVAAHLVLQGHWRPNTMELGLQSFARDVAPDLQWDVPALPVILRSELYPLVQQGFLQAAHF